jgi:PKD repeat protein
MIDKARAHGAEHMVRAFRALALLSFVAVAAGCSVENTTAPPLSGPSELALSLTLAASPDILAQDGASQSQVIAVARDSTGKALANVTLRLEIAVGGQLVDYGTLSSKTVVTGSDGRATAAYTSPRSATVAVDTGTVVTVQATPIGSNYANAVARTVDIRLVPTGVIVPPSDLVAGFTYSPVSLTELDTVVFSAPACSTTVTAGCSGGSIASWSWTFGDGGTASGQVVTHQFSAGSYPVTLTVKDPANRAVSTTQTVSVKSGTNPTASFVISPSAPVVGQTVFFNAIASSAVGTRTIVDYQWNFGNGHTARGVTATHAFEVAGTYTVTLAVVDDAGRMGTSTATVTIAVPK